MEAPKSSMASAKVKLPIVQGIVKVPGSSHFCGRLDCGSGEICELCISVETILPRFSFSFVLNFLLVVHNSFKNLAYLGICLIASSKGILISTFLNVSRNYFSNSSFFDFTFLEGKGRGS
ncbi:hypothetical protein Fmac_026401 [Flemingia macrophylla]|uniref:Uncharacterized protein n=1 Tax=Flemingia macrophylla TaxID=520843 RepID=A0ABD1LEW9_9FABA